LSSSWVRWASSSQTTIRCSRKRSRRFWRAPPIEIVGFAEDGLEAVGLAAIPDVLLMDDKLAYSLVPAVLAVAGARARLSGDGGAELAGRARVG
jgi:hypothetical protein